MLSQAGNYLQSNVDEFGEAADDYSESIITELRRWDDDFPDGVSVSCASHFWLLSVASSQLCISSS
jgi:hypothetical protein